LSPGRRSGEEECQAPEKVPQEESFPGKRARSLGPPKKRKDDLGFREKPRNLCGRNRNDIIRKRPIKKKGIEGLTLGTDPDAQLPKKGNHLGNLTRKPQKAGVQRQQDPDTLPQKKKGHRPVRDRKTKSHPKPFKETKVGGGGGRVNQKDLFRSDQR
jgi:hypothetical protein